MFLEIISVLTLFLLILVVIFLLLHDRSVLHNLRKNREFSKIREDRLEIIVQQSVETAMLVIDHQLALDKQIEKFSKFMNEQTSYVSSKLELFNKLAKSDMLTARRDELIRTKETKAALERVVTITTMSRQPVATSDSIALESVIKRIKELEDILAEGGVNGSSDPV